MGKWWLSYQADWKLVITPIFNWQRDKAWCTGQWSDAATLAVCAYVREEHSGDDHTGGFVSCSCISPWGVRKQLFITIPGCRRGHHHCIWRYLCVLPHFVPGLSHLAIQTQHHQHGEEEYRPEWGQGQLCDNLRVGKKSQSRACGNKKKDETMFIKHLMGSQGPWFNRETIISQELQAFNLVAKRPEPSSMTHQPGGEAGMTGETLSFLFLQERK